MSEDLRLIREALADRLGLERATGTLRGKVGGAPLTVDVAVTRLVPESAFVISASTGQVTQTVQQLQLTVNAQLPFRPRLDAGLKVGPAGGFLALQSVGRTGPEQRLVVVGSSPERTAALVGAEALGALDRSFVGDPGPRLDDGGLSWSWRGLAPWPSVDVLGEAIAQLPPAWTAIQAAARTVSPPEAVQEAWLVLAGMALVPGVAVWGSPAGVIGEVDGVGVSVTVAPHHDGAWFARCSVVPKRPIKGNPKVVREDRLGWFDRVLEAIGGRPEIEVGDSAFDRRFAIRTLKPDELVALLDADVRKAMLALDRLVAVELGPTGIEARGPVRGEKDLVHVVQATLALARFVADATP